jgi:hypothetical protein
MVITGIELANKASFIACDTCPFSLGIVIAIPPYESFMKSRAGFVARVQQILRLLALKATPPHNCCTENTLYGTQGKEEMLL